MKKLVLAAMAVLALSFAAQASAGGYAGSRYSKSDCTYTKATNILYCEATFTTKIPNSTAQIFVNDPTCVGSGQRVFQRTGTIIETFRGFDWYTGRVPLAKNDIAGDEDSFVDTWAPGYVDVDLGCLV
jgi:hypothetical protein